MKFQFLISLFIFKNFNHITDFKIFTTNLVYGEDELMTKEWYQRVDMSKYVAYLIDTINYDNSISELLNPIDRINNVINKYNEK